MISLADWQRQGAPGVLQLRESKGRGRLKLIFVERKNGGFEVRHFNYAYPSTPIWRQWYSNLEQIGERMTRMGTVKVQSGDVR